MKKEFATGDKKYFVTLPSAKQERDAVIVYAKSLTTAIKNGIQSRDNIDKWYRQQGLWDDEREKEKTELQFSIAEGQDKLSKGGIKKSEAKEIAIQMRQNRFRLLILLAELVKLAQYTAEGIAENDKFDFLVSICTKNEDGTRAFSSVEDLYDKEDSELARLARRNFGVLYSGLDEDYEKKLPENEFLVKYGFANENLDLIDKDGKLVDTKGESLEEVKVEFTEFLDD